MARESKLRIRKILKAAAVVSCREGWGEHARRGCAEGWWSSGEETGEGDIFWDSVEDKLTGAGIR